MNISKQRTWPENRRKTISEKIAGRRAGLQLQLDGIQVQTEEDPHRDDVIKGSPSNFCARVNANESSIHFLSNWFAVNLRRLHVPRVLDDRDLDLDHPAPVAHLEEKDHGVQDQDLALLLDDPLLHHLFRESKGFYCAWALASTLLTYFCLF